MPRNVSRRRFLQTSAAAGAAVVGGRLLPAFANKFAANERLHVGVVGVTNQGAYDWENVERAGAAIVALCDVDENRAASVRKRLPNAKYYIDFRHMMEQKDLDAVIVATPDHVHAPATLAALRAGFHVYCEKPLTHTVAEARLVAETAAKQQRVTQMGTQIHAGANYRRAVEVIQSGAIGPVREVHVWCGRVYFAGDRPRDVDPVPAGLHWDLWLGPAPERPFVHRPDNRGYGVYHPFNWRNWWDFGGGTLADMACHYTDLPFWALKLRHPTKVAAEGDPLHPESAPKWLIVHYEYPARGDLPPVKLTWYDGGKRPKHFGDGTLPQWGDGVLFVGKKGMMIADYSRFKLLPDEQFKDYQPPKPSIADSVGHHREWVEACKNGGSTTCNFDYSGALTEAVLLGNVSFRLGKPLTWDAKNLKAINEPEAEKFVHKEYRKGWSL